MQDLVKRLGREYMWVCRYLSILRESYCAAALYWIQVANGVEALKACVAKLKDQKKDLFALGDTEYIFLQFSFKKISLQRQTTKMYDVFICCKITF